MRISDWSSDVCSSDLRAMATQNPWLAAIFIGMGLFAHQGFSTNIFGLTTDVVPVIRVASVIAVGAIAGNISGTAMIEFTGWSLTNGLGYAPMFVISGGAYGSEEHTSELQSLMRISY